MILHFFSSPTILFLNMGYSLICWSQRCILLSLKQALRRKTVRGTLLSASVIGSGYVCTFHQQNDRHSRMFLHGHQGIFPESLISCSLSTASLPLGARISETQKTGTLSWKIGNKGSSDNLTQTGRLSFLKHLHSGDVNKKKDYPKKELREKKVFSVPNILCFARILASPFLGYFVLSESYQAALMLFILAGFTDLLDGFIARSFPSQMTYLGSVLDPIADKILVGVLTISLSIIHLIPVPLAAIILGRDAGLILSSFAIRYISLPQPRTFSRFFDVQLPTVEITPSVIGKVNTALQLALIALSLTAPVFDFTGNTGLTALQYVVGLTTIISGMDYMVSGRGVNILTKSDKN